MDEARDSDVTNPVDLSVEAALELEELKQNKRSDVPALNALFHILRTPGPAFEGEGISLLADVRAYALLRDSLGGGANKSRPTDLKEFSRWIEKYLRDLETGVSSHQANKIDEAKRFCLALNTHMLARQMNELYRRRERSDAQNFDHEPSS